MSISTLNPNLDQNSATGWFMAQLPTPLLAGFAALVFATMMSTVSSGAQSVVVNITRDIIGVLKPNVSSERMLFLSRALSLVTMAVATVMCLVFTDTLTWLVATYAFSAATLACPIYVGYLYRNKIHHHTWFDCQHDRRLRGLRSCNGNGNDNQLCGNRYRSIFCGADGCQCIDKTQKAE